MPGMTKLIKRGENIINTNDEKKETKENIEYIFFKSVAYSSQGSPTVQLYFFNWLEDCSTTG